VDRIGGECFERVDLLGDAHRSDLCRHRRADSASDHEADQHGRELAQHRQCHHASDEVLGVHTLKSRVGLQREHHAREHRGEKNDRDGVDADAHHLPHPLADFIRPAQAPDDGAPEHPEPEAGLFEESDENTAEPFEECGHENRERIVMLSPSR
jgi:hypothetical protein